MTRVFLAAAFLLSLRAAPGFAQSTATLMGVDVYRSESVTAEQLQEKLSALIGSYVLLRNDGRKSTQKRAEMVKAEMERAIRGLGDFAFVRMAFNEYFTSARHSAYITFDVVDAKDAGSRMPFRAAPQRASKDPQGLIAAWRRYVDLGSSLRMKGVLSTERPVCAGFYCLWGSATPELEALEKKFIQEAPPNKAALLSVLTADQDPEKRAAAAYLFSYLPDGAEVSGAMADALADPDETVRGAALQVLADIAIYHQDVPIAADKVIAALDFPTTSDRSNAMAVLVGLSENPVYRPAILRKASPSLVELLKLKQPSNQDLAYTLLGLLSHRSHDRRDYQAWESWAAKQLTEPEKKKTGKRLPFWPKR